MSNDKAPDLCFVTTDEMVAELKRRFAAMVIATMADLDGRRTGTGLYFSGPHTACMGLADLLHMRIVEDWHASTELTDDREEVEDDGE